MKTLAAAFVGVLLSAMLASYAHATWRMAVTRSDLVKEHIPPHASSIVGNLGTVRVFKSGNASLPNWSKVEISFRLLGATFNRPSYGYVPNRIGSDLPPSLFSSDIEESVSSDASTVTYTLRAMGIKEDTRKSDLFLSFGTGEVTLHHSGSIRVAVTVRLIQDGQDSLDEPRVWLDETATLARRVSVLGEFGAAPAAYPTAYAEFPSKGRLTIDPHQGFGHRHAVRELAEGNHMFVAELNSDHGPSPNRAIAVHASLRVRGGGTAFMDLDGDGAGSPDEAFSDADADGLRWASAHASHFAGAAVPVYFKPDAPIIPQAVGLCVEVRYEIDSMPQVDEYGCVSAQIAYDAYRPEDAVGLSGPNGMRPSALTLTCLDAWETCQVLAECRDRDGMAFEGQLSDIEPGATAVYSAAGLGDDLAPMGFLSSTDAQPGHCRFHSSRELSVLHRTAN